MKTLEEIKQDYQNYEKESLKVRNPEDLAIYAEIIRDDILDDITIVQRDTARNNRSLAISRIVSKVFPVYEERVEYYERDNRLLHEELILGLEWRHYLELLQQEVTEEQLKEFARLLDFSVDHYHGNASYLESQRDDLELAFNGIMSFNAKYQDTREAFKPFFEQKLSELTTKKDIQKSIKI